MIGLSTKKIRLALYVGVVELEVFVFIVSVSLRLLVLRVCMRALSVNILSLISGKLK